MELLKALIVVSEKAANIARVCRKNEHLFELLVQKKSTQEANPRFVEDFKTLADVLIQEMVKHDVGKRFPELSECIKGEENNIFQNKLDESICVEVKVTREETSILLERVLNGDKLAADLLAEEVHKEITIEDVNTKIPDEHELDEFDVDLRELGIWIDPIDCTTEYIHGDAGSQICDIYQNGLQCVTILIGAFNKITGQPVMGVINRPFLNEVDSTSHYNCVWGVCLDNIRINSGFKIWKSNKIVCISSSEVEEVKNNLIEAGYKLVSASGAGYKILTVILGLADAYILTKPTTFKWDTCAPQAILKTVGGDVVSFSHMEPITYSMNGSNCNSHGVVAYRSRKVADELQKVFNSSN